MARPRLLGAPRGNYNDHAAKRRRRLRSLGGFVPLAAWLVGSAFRCAQGEDPNSGFDARSRGHDDGDAGCAATGGDTLT
jgi:hypothetical protein